MSKQITPEMVAPELRPGLAKLPNAPLHSALFRRLSSFLMRLGPKPDLTGVTLEVRKSDPAVRIYRPDTRRGDGALLWIHGGGYIVGIASMNDDFCAQIARDLGIVVVSVEYRLAPRHPFPSALDDCHAAWRWMVDQAQTLGIDPRRIAIGGASAGGGLAAGLTLRICDEPGIDPAAQWLLAPMIDDRTAAREELDGLGHPLWHNGLNRLGWSKYLGVAPGSEGVSVYAAPSRREDLSGLPPAWIGVGSIELFLDEDIDYARRLDAAGVPTTLEVAEGAPHGFEAWGKDTAITRRHIALATQWLGEHIGERVAA